MTIWHYKEYKAWLDSGCPENETVTELELSENNLTSIPPEIGKLRSLIYIWLNNNNLVSIPPEIGQLGNLTTISLRGNNLTSIPPEIGKLGKLIELNLYNNRLTSIPPEIGQLGNLTTFSLSGNNLISIPPEIGQLGNLTQLLLSGNNLISIPPEIGQLRNLTIIQLSGNNLTSIPHEIGQLGNLTILSINNNRLISIPSEIGQLGNLTILWLYNNNLTSIPPEIGQLRNLTHLLLSRNNFTSIPSEIGQLGNLTLLSLENNPIEHIPLNIARLLERQRRVLQGVYADAQSVHNATIQQTLRESMMRLLSEKITEKDVIPLVLGDSVLTPFTKESLIEYSRDESIHTALNVTFSDVLVLVWNRIMISPHSEDIKTVLNSEMTDAECKCFTGRISRLVNCLNGFDELVVIKISDNEQIGNVISVVKMKLEEANEYTVERHKAEAGKLLQELGVNDEEIAIWLEYIEQ